MASMFGTDGIRGVVNVTMTPKFALRLGKAAGKVLGGKVAIATDTRSSADMIKSAVSSGLVASGCDVLDLGILPVPALQHYVKVRADISGGIMVTASHNPPEFNGIKCISSDGTEASRGDERKIEEAFSGQLDDVDWLFAGDIDEVEDAEDEYVDSVVSSVDAEAIRSAGLTVCADCANGASYSVVPAVLGKLGVRTVAVNCYPSAGPSKNGPAELKALMAASNADFGVTFDEDADRCFFTAPDGRDVSGDAALAIIARSVLSDGPGKVFTPVSTSSMVEDVVSAAGGVVIRTPVGAPAVARMMMESDSVLGGEESGGLIFPRHQYCRDGAMAMAAMLECVAKRGSLSDQLDSLPAYHSVKTKVACPEDKRDDLYKRMLEKASECRVDRTDGLKLLFDDGWVLLRASGTEPSFRIFSESKDAAKAESRAAEYVSMAEEFLGGDLGS
jgi:phosphomannomutase/phosphoglucomutase